MTKFTDKNGQAWDVELTVGVARKAFDISKPETVSAILDDPFQRFDLLWLLCSAQAESRNLTQEAFDQLVADERTFVEANAALLESIEAFFRRIGKESLALLMQKTRAAAKSLDALATEKVSNLDSTLQTVIANSVATLEAEITKAGKLSLSSPESSESTQTP
ncbi:MAG: hypothetical protein ACTHK7_01940 [Aureliella sp.]